MADLASLTFLDSAQLAARNLEVSRELGLGESCEFAQAVIDRWQERVEHERIVDIPGQAVQTRESEHCVVGGGKITEMIIREPHCDEQISGMQRLVLQCAPGRYIWIFFARRRKSPETWFKLV